MGLQPGVVADYRISFAVPTVDVGPAAARRVAREVFKAWDLDLERPPVDSALVILSELVTNTVKHAAVLCTQADVTLSLTGLTLRVAVHDRHPFRPAATAAPHPDDTGGWGLQLVRDLTAQAGGLLDIPADADGAGKTVLVELPLAA